MISVNSRYSPYLCAIAVLAISAVVLIASEQQQPAPVSGQESSTTNVLRQLSTKEESIAATRISPATLETLTTSQYADALVRRMRSVSWRARMGNKPSGDAIIALLVDAHWQDAIAMLTKRIAAGDKDAADVLQTIAGECQHIRLRAQRGAYVEQILTNAQGQSVARTRTDELRAVLNRVTAEPTTDEREGCDAVDTLLRELPEAGNFASVATPGNLDVSNEDRRYLKVLNQRAWAGSDALRLQEGGVRNWELLEQMTQALLSADMATTMGLISGGDIDSRMDTSAVELSICAISICPELWQSSEPAHALPQKSSAKTTANDLEFSSVREANRYRAALMAIGLSTPVLGVRESDLADVAATGDPIALSILTRANDVYSYLPPDERYAWTQFYNTLASHGCFGESGYVLWSVRQAQNGNDNSLTSMTAAQAISAQQQSAVLLRSNLDAAQARLGCDR